MWTYWSAVKLTSGGLREHARAADDTATSTLERRMGRAKAIAAPDGEGRKREAACVAVNWKWGLGSVSYRAGSFLCE